MADEPGAPPAEDGVAAPPPGGDNAGAGQEPNAGSTDDDRIRELRQEAASYRRRLREQEAANAELAERMKRLEAGSNGEDAAKRASELEATNGTLRQQLRDAALNVHVATASIALGVRDADAAMALLDRSAVEWDGDQPDGSTVRQALEALLESKPYLRADQGKPQPTAPAGTGAGASAPGVQHQPPAETDADRRRRLYGGGGASMWDPVEATRRGGGVVT
jgi:hypothetical protein